MWAAIFLTGFCRYSATRRHTEADWPDDIVVVYTEDIVDVVPFNVPIAVNGKLSLGTYRDEEIGFVSRVRLVDASYARL